MKNLKLSLLALSALTGGSLAASAATLPYPAYSVNTTFTNPVSQYWRINGGPQTIGSTLPEIFTELSLLTDGSGKITGSGWVVILNSSNGVPTTEAVVDVSGNISAKTENSPTVKLAMHGGGFTVNSNGIATLNNVTLTFSGTPGADKNNTNNSNQVIVGNFNGVVTGSSVLGAKTSKITNVAGEIGQGSSGTSFVNVSPEILATTKTMLLFDTRFLGHGTIKDSTYKFTANGIGFSKGSMIAANGNLGPYTNSFGPSNSITFQAPSSMTISKGKIQGQAVSGSASQVQAYLNTGGF